MLIFFCRINDAIAQGSDAQIKQDHYNKERSLFLNLWFGDSKPGIQELEKGIIARLTWVK